MFPTNLRASLIKTFQDCGLTEPDAIEHVEQLERDTEAQCRQAAEEMIAKHKADPNFYK